MLQLRENLVQGSAHNNDNDEILKRGISLLRPTFDPLFEGKCAVTYFALSLALGLHSSYCSQRSREPKWWVRNANPNESCRKMNLQLKLCIMFISKCRLSTLTLAHRVCYSVNKYSCYGTLL